MRLIYNGGVFDSGQQQEFNGVTYPPRFFDDQTVWTEYGITALALVAQPTFDNVTQTCSELAPMQVNGVWTQQWQVTALPLATVEMNVKTLVQNQLDTTARTRGYDDMHSLVSYAGDPDPKFNAEGAAGRTWRSAYWQYSYNVLAQVQGGAPMPTSTAFLSGAPQMVWPS
ncbi:MAG: hypothetical protein JO253_06005 [Alphaproteobacteria bacterium]|nr:hypothetical protein [Alphaproteobacteria bacterium]